mmetsp:Transcript_21242/g.29776  ORF Transcript_21242/g.29776 Transcript_21242/m.29776 type:complete len:370 (+) Transcript_21242:70-1179(+)
MLSRSELYTPLSDLHNPNDKTSIQDHNESEVSNSQSPIRQNHAFNHRKIPQNKYISHRERSLYYDFLQNVSNEYHSPNSIFLAPSTNFANKNSNLSSSRTGGGFGGRQPLTSRQMENKLAQRALTLVGGGVGTKGSKRVRKYSQRPRFRINGSISKRSRKRMLRAQNRQSQRCTATSAEKEKNDPNMNNLQFTVDSQRNNTEKTDILLSLNRLWNEYFFKLVGESDLISAASGNGDLVDNHISEKLRAKIFNMEKVGAFVKIIECKSSRSYEENLSVIVNSTKNTWIMVMTSIQRRSKSSITKHLNVSDGEFSDINKRDWCWKNVIVPKNGTTLAFCIPAPRTSAKGEDIILSKKTNDDRLSILVTMEG